MAYIIPEYRSPAWNAAGTIDCEINHPQHGWIPFTCDPDDASPPIDSAALYGEIEATGGIAPAPVPTLAKLKADKLAALASARWQVETGGMDFNGYSVPTDRETSSIVTSAYVKAKEDSNYSISNFKVAPGTYIALAAQDIIDYGLALEAHVQGAFDHEASLAGQINAATDKAELDAVDITSGW